jgi:hypothetical protein
MVDRINQHLFSVVIGSQENHDAKNEKLPFIQTEENLKWTQK